MSEVDHRSCGIHYTEEETTGIAVPTEVVAEVIDLEYTDLQVAAAREVEIGAIHTTAIVNTITGPAYLGPCAITVCVDRNRVRRAVEFRFDVFCNHQLL